MVLLTVAFLVLYGIGARIAFGEVRRAGDGGSVDTQALAGGTLLGLAMFATLFLGAVLAIFLTLGVIRGDAERGLLQPLVVRPVGRVVLLLGRFVAAVAVCVPYVLSVYAGAVVLTRWAGGWWPNDVVRPGLGLAAGVVVLVALSLLGSVLLTATANGIAVFMLFGAGLVGGLLGQIGEGLSSHTLTRIGHVVAWALPFEALYQSGLRSLTAGTGGLTQVIVRLGPFGGAQSAGPGLWVWAVGYVAVVLGLAAFAFTRRDL